MSGNRNKNIKQAAALKYKPGTDRAPKIVAAGKGEIADKILEAAEQNKVPVYKDQALAQVLNTFKLGDEIPEELYGVVAEILIFVGSLDRLYGERNGRKKD